MTKQRVVGFLLYLISLFLVIKVGIILINAVATAWTQPERGSILVVVVVGIAFVQVILSSASIITKIWSVS